MLNKKILNNLPDVNVNLSAEYSEILLLQNLKCYGFATLENHDLPLSLLDGIYEQWRCFFSNEEKYQWLRADEDDEGFVPLGVEKAKNEDVPDFKEFYQTHYQGRYPSIIDTQSTFCLVSALVTLSEKLIKLLEIALPTTVKEKMCISLSEMVLNSSKHLLRVVHYPPMLKGMTLPKSAPHGDICLLTILVNATRDGLALKSHDGNWYVPEIEKTEVIVFNSDMLDMCTKGYLKSVTHEVQTNSNNAFKNRYSIAFSVHPKRDTELKTGFTAGEFLQERLNDMGFNGHMLKINDH
ncbi:MAG: hypothetical protein K2Q14_00240 [Gammaproteobacteria bacterium]|nr:hypothetical protein [Gammaproteobacteria bacterium]